MEKTEDHKVKLDLALSKKSEVVYEIRNHQDQLVKTERKKEEASGFQHALDLSGYDEGIYFITIGAGPFKKTLKVNRSS